MTDDELRAALLRAESDADRLARDHARLTGVLAERDADVTRLRGLLDEALTRWWQLGSAIPKDNRRIVEIRRAGGWLRPGLDADH